MTYWTEHVALGAGEVTKSEVYAQAAAFYVVLVKNGYGAEATEFAEWFLDTFDIDLET